MARRAERDAFNVADGMKGRRDASKEEAASAELELEETEDDLLDAEEGSSEDLAADVRHQKALKRFSRALTDLGKVKSTLKLAKADLKKAQKCLTAAREDVEAVRQGRRKPNEPGKNR
jgi:hypothetical protein